MRLDHHDYTKLVIGTYKKRRAKGNLSRLIAQSTPASIRQECANVYQEGCEKKDEPTLRAFFGPEEHGKKFLELIKGFDADKFRPLDSYLKEDGKKGISVKSLELLAWLIGFRHRPFMREKEVFLNEEEEAIINDKTREPIIKSIEDDNSQLPIKENEEDTFNQRRAQGASSGSSPELKESEKVKDETGNELDKKPVTVDIAVDPQSGRKKNLSERALLYLLIFVVCIGTAYIIWQQNQDKQMMALGNPNIGCMYWAGDHYETVSCADKNSNRLKLPLDLEKMRTFKKITREDTITEKSIGKIYYIRINGGREYYTAGGNHPVEVTKTLKVFSRYMFEQHFRDKAPVNGSVAQGTLKFINNR